MSEIRQVGSRAYAFLIDPLLAGARIMVRERVASGASVLDVACGTGDLARLLAPGCRQVVGVELDPRRVAYARRRAGPNQSFMVADARRLPFEDGRFDVSTISMGLHEMPMEHRCTVLNELLRVGRDLLVVDYATPLPRNPVALGVRLIERGAGRAHNAGFHSFLANGGLVALARRCGAVAEPGPKTAMGCIQLWRVVRASPGSSESA